MLFRSQLKVDATRYGKSRFYFRYALFPNPVGFMIWFRIFAFICKIDRIHIFSTIVKQVYKINSLIMGYDIPLHTQIGKGFCLLHYPEVVINGKAKIGNFVTIFYGVTIGAQFWGFFNIGTIMFGVLFVYMIICLVMYLTTEHVTPYEVTAGPLAGNYRYTAHWYLKAHIQTRQTT